jgi:hypothetical protein
VSGPVRFTIQPAGPPSAYKTYQIRAPLASHFTELYDCARARCEGHLLGWDSLIDETTTAGQEQAAYIRGGSGRRFTEERQPAGLTLFRFEPGQDCFRRPHLMRNTRPETYVERGGDWRGNPSGQRRVHTRPEDWVESFAGHQARIKTLLERG